MSKIQVIVGSTRPARVGRSIAQWIMNQVSQRPDVENELVDLADLHMPMLDEPYLHKWGNTNMTIQRLGVRRLLQLTAM